MNLNEFIDDILDELRIAGVKGEWDRWDFLNWASSELNRLSGEFGNADCFMVHLNPAVSTVAGTRNYDLSENFGTNFVPSSGDQGEGHCCMLDDGTNEKQLTYIAPAQFYSQNLTGETSGTPAKYTIIGSPNGRKQIALSPPPDGVYEINGLHVPTDWDLKTMDSIPALPGNSHLLKYAVLKRISKERWEQDYREALAKLYLEFAKSSKGRIAPYLGSARNSYMRTY